MSKSSSPQFVIREAKIEDLPALVEIHLSSWNETYPDYNPKPTRELRTRQWEIAFGEKPDNWFCLAAVTENDIPVGFATGADFHDEALPFESLLDKIHILRDFRRMGIGHRLIQAVGKRFLERGYNSLILFADPGNPNTRFYERLGGERILDQNGEFQGAYGWKDLQQLVRAAIKFIT